MAFDFKKEYKEFYMPKNKPQIVAIPKANYIAVRGKQISFQYYDYTGLKKKVLKNKGEVYKFSPYKLLWCGDYYYVLGYSEKKSLSLIHI